MSATGRVPVLDVATVLSPVVGFEITPGAFEHVFGHCLREGRFCEQRRRVHAASPAKVAKYEMNSRSDFSAALATVSAPAGNSFSISVRRSRRRTLAGIASASTVA